MIRKRGDKLLLNPAVSLPFAALAFMMCILTYADAPAQNGSVSQQVQDEQIRTLQRQVEINGGRITSLELRGSYAAQNNSEEIKVLSGRIIGLEQSVWLWKGIVFGFGSIISLVEILQALGIIRYKPRKEVM